MIKKITNFEQQPSLIQGGMGVAVSNWELAGAVAETGEAGTVSLTAIGTVFANRLNDGDTTALQALREFPDQALANKIFSTYYKEGGRAPDEPYKATPILSAQPSRRAEELCVIGAFCEVRLAQQRAGAQRGPIGVNALHKLCTSVPATIYGAMLAGADFVAMGAGVPREVPHLMRDLAKNKPSGLALHVLRATDSDVRVKFDPRPYNPNGHVLKRPAFLPIVASHLLAQELMRGEISPDGFIVEGPLAGGHNAPPRGNEHDAKGQPIYDERDEPNLRVFSNLDVPFWLAGGYATPEGLQGAVAEGAVGIQAGSVFALCAESGLRPDLKSRILDMILYGAGVVIYVDDKASPTGFPFRIAHIPGTLSDKEVYKKRPRLCDRGFLKIQEQNQEGQVFSVCPAEAENVFLARQNIISPSKEDDTPQKLEMRRAIIARRLADKICLCNALLSTAGYSQVRHLPDGSVYLEPSLVTLGETTNEDLRAAAQHISMPPRAADMARYLNGKQ